MGSYDDSAVTSTRHAVIPAPHATVQIAHDAAGAHPVPFLDLAPPIEGVVLRARPATTLIAFAAVALIGLVVWRFVPIEDLPALAFPFMGATIPHQALYHVSGG